MRDERKMFSFRPTSIGSYINKQDSFCRKIITPIVPCIQQHKNPINICWFCKAQYLNISRCKTKFFMALAVSFFLFWIAVETYSTITFLLPQIIVKTAIKRATNGKNFIIYSSQKQRYEICSASFYRDPNINASRLHVTNWWLRKKLTTVWLPVRKKSGDEEIIESFKGIVVSLGGWWRTLVSAWLIFESFHVYVN